MDAANSQMDVLRTKGKSPWRRPSIPLVTAAIAVVAILVLGSGWVLQPQQKKVARANLLVSSVQRGNFDAAVNAYGVLRSNEQVLITALTPATVEEVALRPGAPVKPDSVILRLSNPDLLEELERARVALAQEEADARRLELTNERELLSEQSALAKARSEHKVLQLRNEAQKGLAAEGIISKLDYQASSLNEQLQLEGVQLQEKRIEQLRRVAHESQLIQREKIKGARAAFQNVQHRADRLIVRAGIDGVLQRLPVELGQSVNAGQELALVGSERNLLALVRVSQSRVDRLKVGQRAEIDTRREKVAGVVTRIAPEVREGTVEVEIRFADGVPFSARPELNVDARIFAARLQNALFMERPANVQPHSRGSLFRLEPDGHSAVRSELAFGEESGRYLQVLSGASLQDRFILSDMSALRDEKRIALVD